MKFIQLFFVLILCTAISCTDSKVDDKATVSEALTQPVVEKIETKAEDIADKEAELLASELAKKEAEKLKEEQKHEAEANAKKEKEEAAAKKRRAKRRKERAERKKREQEKEEEEVIEELKKKSIGTAKAAFVETEFNFGVISQGDKIDHNFVFTNVGDGDLEILNVDVTCGCTVPTFPFLPIAPGEKGTIGVTYNSTGKLGNQKPMITIITNAKPHTYKIYMKGVVDAERAKTKETAADSNEKN